MEISTQAPPMSLSSDGYSTKWCSTLFATPPPDRMTKQRTAILVFALNGPVVGSDLGQAVTKSKLPSTVKYPVGLLSSQIAKLACDDFPATVVVTGKGLYVSQVYPAHSL